MRKITYQFKNGFNTVDFQQAEDLRSKLGQYKVVLEDILETPEGVKKLRKKLGLE